MSLPENAFGVYRDAVVSDGMAKNEQLKEENKAWKAAREYVASFKLSRGRYLLSEINLLEDEPTHDTADRLIFDLDIPNEIPIEDMCSLNSVVAGSFSSSFGCIPTDPISMDVQTSGLVILVFPVADGVYVCGTVSNINGTPEQVQSMIEENQHTMFFVEGPFREAAAQLGEPIPVARGDHILDGSVFSFSYIMMYKAGIQSILDLKFAGQQEAEIQQLLADTSELAVLAQTFPYRSDISMLLTERKVVQKANMAFKSARNLVQSVQFLFPDEQPLCLKLEHGYICEDDERPCLTIPIPEISAPTISLSSIIRLEIKLGGRPWLNEDPMAGDETEHRVLGDFLHVQYAETCSADFDFGDDKLDPVVARNYMAYVDHVLSGRTTDYAGPDYDDLRMRFFSISMYLDGRLAERLGILGLFPEQIVAREPEDDDEDQEMDEDD